MLVETKPVKLIEAENWFSWKVMDLLPKRGFMWKHIQETKKNVYLVYILYLHLLQF